MSHAKVIADANVNLATDAESLMQAIDTFFECAASCTACADACLAEDEPQKLRDCITLNNVCAEICTATGRSLARITQGSYAVLGKQLEACIEACRACGDECRSHAQMHTHCAACAEVCERAEQAAKELLEALP